MSARSYRMVSPEDLAAGRHDKGRLVVAGSDEEAKVMAREGETPVRILSAREVAHRRLDQKMNERVKRDEDEATRRNNAAIDRFVKALTGENN